MAFYRNAVALSEVAELPDKVLEIVEALMSNGPIVQEVLGLAGSG